MAEDVRHKDGTVSVVIDDLCDHELAVFLEAGEWFMAKSPEERGTVIVRAYLDREAWEPVPEDQEYDECLMCPKGEGDPVPMMSKPGWVMCRKCGVIYQVPEADWSGELPAVETDVNPAEFIQWSNEQVSEKAAEYLPVDYIPPYQ